MGIKFENDAEVTQNDTSALQKLIFLLRSIISWSLSQRS